MAPSPQDTYIGIFANVSRGHVNKSFILTLFIIYETMTHVIPQSVLLPIMGGTGMTLVLPIMGVRNFITKLRSYR
jgi:hypothetical protein